MVVEIIIIIDFTIDIIVTIITTTITTKNQFTVFIKIIIVITFIASDFNLKMQLYKYQYFLH